MVDAGTVLTFKYDFTGKLSDVSDATIEIAIILQSEYGRQLLSTPSMSTEPDCSYIEVWFLPLTEMIAKGTLKFISGEAFYDEDGERRYWIDRNELRVVMERKSADLLWPTWERIRDGLEDSGILLRYDQYLPKASVDVEKSLNEKYYGSEGLESATPLKVVTPQIETLNKIQELIRRRTEYITDNRDILPKTKACQLIGIDPKTVKQHCDELWRRWGDREFMES